jgi:hypothetical protein
MEIPDLQKLDKWEDTIHFPSVSTIFFHHNLNCVEFLVFRFI